MDSGYIPGGKSTGFVDVLDIGFKRHGVTKNRLVQLGKQSNHYPRYQDDQEKSSYVRE